MVRIEMFPALAFLVLCVGTSSFRLSLGMHGLRKATNLKMSEDGGQRRPRIAVTRERDCNHDLVEFLSDFDCVELPCIMFEPVWEAGELADKILEHDYVMITSPYAACIFDESWRSIGSPAVKVVSVGDGTTDVLKSYGITPVFQPSEASGEALARELPLSLGTKALYPCSKLAGTLFGEVLAERGITVTRVDTYTTHPARHWTSAMTDLAKTVDIATFASPSAIKHWVDKVGTDAKAVTIGPTTAAEARRLGFKEVYFPPESGGLEPFVDMIRSVALGEV